MGATEFLTLVFLYNAAVTGGQYAGPAFLQWVGNVVGQLRRRNPAAKHQAGALPRSVAGIKTIETLEQYAHTHSDLYSRELDAAELRLRVESSLANRFAPDIMRGPLRTQALIIGYIGVPNNDPAVVANALYDLARNEEKVHWLVDAMLRYPGRGAGVRQDLLAE